MGDDRGTGSARPFRPATGNQDDVPRPPLPDDERPDLPRGLRHQLQRQVSDAIADDVMLAMSIGAAAVQAERPEAALRHLRWVKAKAPRVADVREALGIAHYHREEYGDALSELRAYRRMTGRLDQNHVIADCRRALGDPAHEVGEEIESMLPDEDIPAERRLEGVLVWASHLADEGSIDGARVILRRGQELLAEAEDADDTARARFRYVEGDLAARAGDAAAARAAFEAVVSAEGSSYDAVERLEHL